MTEIKHLIETDYKGNYNNMGERIEAIEEQLLDSSYMTLTNENVRSFQVGKDSNGVSTALDSTNSSMGLEGQTLVNLLLNSNIVKDYEVANQVKNMGSVGVLKPNVTYTVIYTITATSGTHKITMNLASGMSKPDISLNKSNTIGTHKQSFIIEEGLYYPNRCISFYFFSEQVTAGATATMTDVMILEGDWTERNIPEYFEGLMSTGQSNNDKIEILSIGKNLLNISNEFTWTGTARLDNLKIPKGNYIVTYENETHEGSSSPVIRFYDNEITISCDRGNSHNVTLTKDETLMYIYSNGYSYAGSENVSATISKLMISPSGGEYEPFISNKTEILLNEPLRGLPNDVRDTLEIKDGKLIITRHCKEVDLSTLSWQPFGSWVQTIVDDMKYVTSNTEIGNALCTNYVIRTGNGFSTATIGQFAIDVNNIKFQTNNYEAPLGILCYELAKPTIEEFDLLNPILYKDGHVFLETGAIPCSSVSHEVALNTRAQVKNNSKAIVSSRNIYDGMVSEYDGMLLELDYDHTVFDFEYNINKLKLEEV